MLLWLYYSKCLGVARMMSSLTEFNADIVSDVFWYRYYCNRDIILRL